MKNYSKLPWEVRPASSNTAAKGYNIYSKGVPASAGRIAHLPHREHLGPAADAHFIVTACNAHHKLVAAVEKLLAQAGRLDSGEGVDSEEYDATLEISKTALQLARGES